MNINPTLSDLIRHWAYLCESDESRLMLCDKNPEVNNRSDHRRVNPSRPGSSPVRSVVQHSKPDDPKRTMGDIVPKSLTEVNRRIQEYRNGDKSLDFSSISKLSVGFQRLLGMSYWSGSRYLKIRDGQHLTAFRLSNHRAVGEYFKLASGDCNRHLSIFIGEDAEHVPTPIAYTEIRYTPEAFMGSPRAVVDSIVDSLQKFLQGKEINIPEELGVKSVYEKEI